MADLAVDTAAPISLYLDLEPREAQRIVRGCRPSGVEGQRTSSKHLDLVARGGVEQAVVDRALRLLRQQRRVGA